MNQHFSRICNHTRLVRIDKNFVRCLECGQSMISQQKMLANKTSRDFVNENKNFARNFDRNFSNVLEEVDSQSQVPLYEYYTDKNQINIIIIDRTAKFCTNPPKYEVNINGEKVYLDKEEIDKLLCDLNGIRIDELYAKSRFKLT